MDKLLKNNSSQENKEKLNRLAEILLEINNYTQDFMFGFLKYTRNQIAFLQKLYDLDREYIKEVIIYNMEDESKSKRIDYLNKVLLNYPQYFVFFLYILLYNYLLHYFLIFEDNLITLYSNSLFSCF